MTNVGAVISARRWIVGGCEAIAGSLLVQCQPLYSCIRADNFSPGLGFLWACVNSVWFFQRARASVSWFSFAFATIVCHSACHSGDQAWPSMAVSISVSDF